MNWSLVLMEHLVRVKKLVVSLLLVDMVAVHIRSSVLQ